jgi:hypothetical protein
MDWYAQAFAGAFNLEVDFDDNMTVTLHTSTYTPDRVTHDFVSDLTGEVAAGAGYSTGGVLVGAITRTVTAANSWATQRANSTAYLLGDVVRPATPNGLLYRATTAGTTAGSIPTYPTVLGQTVVDGGVTWEAYGTAILVLTATTPATWAAATFTGVRYAVLSDRTAGTAATQRLIGVHDFVTDRTALGGAFTLGNHATLGYLHLAIY